MRGHTYTVLYPGLPMFKHWKTWESLGTRPPTLVRDCLCYIHHVQLCCFSPCLFDHRGVSSMTSSYTTLVTAPFYWSVMLMPQLMLLNTWRSTLFDQRYKDNKLRTSWCSVIVQWSPSITDTTGTKDFVLYSEVSFAQEVIVDHTPLTIVASYRICLNISPGFYFLPGSGYSASKRDWPLFGTGVYKISASTNNQKY